VHLDDVQAGVEPRRAPRVKVCLTGADGKPVHADEQGSAAQAASSVQAASRSRRFSTLMTSVLTLQISPSSLRGVRHPGQAICRLSVGRRRPDPDLRPARAPRRRRRHPPQVRTPIELRSARRPDTLDDRAGARRAKLRRRRITVRADSTSSTTRREVAAA